MPSNAYPSALLASVVNFRAVSLSKNMSPYPLYFPTIPSELIMSIVLSFVLGSIVCVVCIFVSLSMSRRLSASIVFIC